MGMSTQASPRPSSRRAAALRRQSPTSTTLSLSLLSLSLYIYMYISLSITYIYIHVYIADLDEHREAHREDRLRYFENLII